jgi:hypothetical protein
MSIEIAIKDKTPELMQKLQAAVGRFVRKGAFYFEGQLKTSMAEPKSGRRYPRGKDSFHIASAPGESPAVDSSNYTNSLQVITDNSLEAKIGTPLLYPAFLEEGTDKIAPRPLWAKTAEESLPTLEAMLQAEIRGVH